jgi:hypothetical protein
MLIYLKALGSYEVLTVGTKEGTVFWDVMPLPDYTALYPGR